MKILQFTVKDICRFLRTRAGDRRARKSPVKRLTRLRRQAGFTMIELLVVLAILIVIAGFVVPNFFNILGGAKHDAAKIQIQRLGGVLDIYLLDVGNYPTTNQGLDALLNRPSNAVKWNGPYIKNKATLVDPWGKPYEYRGPGEYGPYDLFSLGADGREGGEDDDKDIVSW